MNLDKKNIRLYENYYPSNLFNNTKQKGFILSIDTKDENGQNVTKNFKILLENNGKSGKTKSTQDVRSFNVVVFEFKKLNNIRKNRIEKDSNVAMSRFAKFNNKYQLAEYIKFNMNEVREEEELQNLNFLEKIVIKTGLVKSTKQRIRDLQLHNIGEASYQNCFDRNNGNYFQFCKF